MAAAERRFRQRRKLPGLNKTKREVLQSRLTAEELLQRFKKLVRLCGGWQELLNALKPGERADLLARLAEIAERESARAEERERRIALSEAELRSSAMQQDLLNMSLEFVVKHPHRMARALAEHRPKAAVRALLETEKGRDALAAAGAQLTRPEA